MTDALTSPPTACCNGVSTTQLAPAESERLAARLAAIADPVRLQMLSILAGAEAGEVCACDFVGPIERSQPTVSHHLRVLADAGLIEGDKRGRWVWYRLVANEVSTLSTDLANVVTGAD